MKYKKIKKSKKIVKKVLTFVPDNAIIQYVVAKGSVGKSFG